MIIKGLIDESYKVSNKDILHLTEEPPVDEVHFAFENDTEENQTSNLPLIERHHHKEFDDIIAKIMDFKAFL